MERLSRRHECTARDTLRTLMEAFTALESSPPDSGTSTAAYDSLSQELWQATGSCLQAVSILATDLKLSVTPSSSKGASLTDAVEGNQDTTVRRLGQGILEHFLQTLRDVEATMALEHHPSTNRKRRRQHPAGPFPRESTVAFRGRLVPPAARRCRAQREDSTSCSGGSSDDEFIPPLRNNKDDKDGPRTVALPAEEAFTVQSASSLPTGFHHLIGVDAAVSALEDMVILPFRHAAWYRSLAGGCRPSSTVLLYGPPGTGKTMLASALAGSLGAVLVQASAAELLSKWFGESERLVRRLFDFARRVGSTAAVPPTPLCHPSPSAATSSSPDVAAAGAPVVIFLDEIDALCSTRGAGGESEVSRRVKTEFLLQLSAISTEQFPQPPRDPLHLSRKSTTPTPTGTRQILVVAATNTPWDVDSAMRRRFDEMIYVGLPDAAARERLLQTELPLSTPTLDPSLRAIAQDMMNGYSGSDIVRILQKAKRSAARRLLTASIGPTDGCPLEVTKEDVVAAVRSYPRSVQAADLQRYEAWAQGK